MKKLQIKMENCYGIRKLEQELDFVGKNLVVIYAANGLMKTSFADSFKDLSVGNQPSDRVSNLITVCDVRDEHGVAVNKEDIIVINSFNQEMMKEQGRLMMNPELKSKYHVLHNGIKESKENLFATIKKQLKYDIRAGFNVEQEVSKDFNQNLKDVYLTLKSINEQIDKDSSWRLDINEINHKVLFNVSALTFYKKDGNHKLLKQYSEKYEELLKQAKFLRKGIFDHKNFGNIAKSLKENGFFNADHKVVLELDDKGKKSNKICDETELNHMMETEKAVILNNAEMKNIFEKISTEIEAKKETKELYSYLQDKPHITAELNDVDGFKKKVWLEILRENKPQLEQLVELYDSTYDAIKILNAEAKGSETKWHDVIKIFNDRFHVPFTIEPSNLEDVILADEVPVFKYEFDIGHNVRKELQEKELLDILSTGERRAYYLLDLIYKINIRIDEKQKSLLVLDDIADSFDYANKFAIIEYLYDTIDTKDANGDKLFNVIVLTHNFDFYRTLGSRLDCKMNCFIASTIEGEIRLTNREYLGNYFEHIKGKCINNEIVFILAAIPFVRNLIEYTYSEGDEEFNDYNKLTCLLHFKEETNVIKISTLETIFNKYWLKNKGDFSLYDDVEPVTTFIFEEAKRIAESPLVYNSIGIENKLVLSMAIRLNAESFMISEIVKYYPDGQKKIYSIYKKKNQTNQLFKLYKDGVKLFPSNYIRMLQKVIMMTPENIHINSFMFEPILDMQGMHLVKLYSDLNKICMECN